VLRELGEQTARASLPPHGADGSEPVDNMTGP
jgi:hypothetical protein